MERKSLSNSLKDHSIGSGACNNSSSSNKLKYSWNFNDQSCGEDYLGGLSWQPRSYTCSFCKREFRSAQALGGHMNVHRRDRARLRQSPPKDGHCAILNLNINPNPNPTAVSPPLTSTLSSSAPPPTANTPVFSALSSPTFASSNEINKRPVDDTPLSTKTFDRTRNKTRKSFFDAEEFQGCAREDGYKFLKKAEIVRLDLEIGLFSDPKKDLDLELRLG